MTSDTVHRRAGYAAFVVFSLAALGLTAILLQTSSGYFQPYFGRTNPLLVIVLAGGGGAISLRFLGSRAGFEIFRGRATLRGIAVSARIATLFAIAIIVADFFIRYPADINVPVPEALLFYPAVGFVAEIAFHVLPLALLLLAFAPLGKRTGADRLVWLCILITAGFEPTFQVALPGNTFSWGAAYTWIHVCTFALCQLYVFRRYDFVSMYAFRLCYYAYWHVIWGVIRLEVLF